MPYTYNIEGTQTPDSNQETNDMSNATSKIKVISQAEAKSLQLQNMIGTLGWNAFSFGTWVKTQKQAEAWVRKVMQGSFMRPDNIYYVWQSEYDNQDGNGYMSQRAWGASAYTPDFFNKI